ncbi:MAG TPA: hypothetical protein VIO94_13070 [Phenylobacterium sp.]
MATPGPDTVIGSPGDDTLDGLAGNDVLVGLAGDDLLLGGTGNDQLLGDQPTGPFGDDTLIGGDGDDVAWGRGGDDSIVGGSGSNISLRGGAGNDTIDGTGGFSIASYLDATGGVTVNLSLAGPQAVGADAGTDVLIGMSGVSGSQTFGDHLTGDAGVNILLAYAGEDTLLGAGGDDSLYGGQDNDSLDGGSGQDWAIYNTDDGVTVVTSGVSVDLSLTGAQFVGANFGFDTLSNIENVRGSALADTLAGDAQANMLAGGGGGDSLVGRGGADTLSGQGGNDTLVGGGDVDTARFSGNLADYSIQWLPDSVLQVTDLRPGSPDGVDRLYGIEALQFADQTISPTLATPGPDHIFGNDTDEIIDGLAGNDTIHGRGGDDLLIGGTGNDQLLGDSLIGPAGNDTLIGGDGDDVAFGRGGNDSIVGGAGIDILRGGAGNDTIDGTGGFGIASYFDATGGVTVDLSNTGPQAVGADAGVDVLINMSAISGSLNFDDHLTGDGEINTLLGFFGDDTLLGGAGNDTLFGGADNDSLDGGSGQDWVHLGIDDAASYVASSATVDLALTGAQFIGATFGFDTLVNFENVQGTALNDTLAGDAQGNVLAGGGGNDSLLGRDGADTLVGQAGADTLVGGSGFDTARFSGDMGDYSIQYLSGSVLLVTDLRGGSPDGADRLIGVEALQFADTTITPNLNLGNQSRAYANAIAKANDPNLSEHAQAVHLENAARMVDKAVGDFL